MIDFSKLSRNFVGVAGAAVFAAACLTGAVSPAHADTAVFTAKVSYADLDLTNPGGRAMLDRRIKTAARAVCASNSRELKQRIYEMRCVKNAVANAVKS